MIMLTDHLKDCVI